MISNKCFVVVGYCILDKTTNKLFLCIGTGINTRSLQSKIF